MLSKNRMENTAETRVETLRNEVADLGRQLQALGSVDPAGLIAQDLVPARGGVKVLRYDLVWVY